MASVKPPPFHSTVFADGLIEYAHGPDGGGGGGGGGGAFVVGCILRSTRVSFDTATLCWTASYPLALARMVKVPIERPARSSCRRHLSRPPSRRSRRPSPEPRRLRGRATWHYRSRTQTPSRPQAERGRVRRGSRSRGWSGTRRR